MNKEREREGKELKSLQNKKKLKYNCSSILSNINSKSLQEDYHQLYSQSLPYPHSFLYPLINDETMRVIYNEAKNNMTATFKETDLFKLFQTCDLGNLSESDELARRMPELMKLRRK